MSDCKSEYAFPPHYNPRSGNIMHGMLLRDYFAVKASDSDVDAVMCDYIVTTRLTTPRRPVHCTYSITRQQARYIHADRMMEARKP
ncbi:hypothetical protein D3C85_1628220 [compost metagenome]